MEKQWFVLHTLSGHEYKVQNSIVSRVKQEELGEFIGDVLIPTEKVSEVKQGKKTTVSRKFFPGYVMANLALYDEKKNLVEETWYFIQNTPGVIGFVGGNPRCRCAPMKWIGLSIRLKRRRKQLHPRLILNREKPSRLPTGRSLTLTE